ncbi:MAG: helicase-related protein, partial [Bdellovibrionota bacterium]
MVWSFDGDGHLFKLASEARRIQLAWLFDPFLAVHTSTLLPLPHQITAVYGEMLPRQPLRFLLADDPGAGKTIMAGLYIKELIIRGDVNRCLIVCPGSLAEQWQDELWEKFGLDFKITTREMIETSRTGNPFSEHNRLIARVDQMARNEDNMARLESSDWDLVIVDEAHKMSAHYYGNEFKATKRYELGKLLGKNARHFLLMTATPHNGDEISFQLFMALLDADRFEGKFRDSVHKIDASGMMRRLIKERLLKFDGRPLFPERRAYSVNYELSDLENKLYNEVTSYVKTEMNRAERIAKEGDKRRGMVVGFALTILQRRLASSPAAIFCSLERRVKRLEKRIAEEKIGQHGTAAAINAIPTPRNLREEDLEDPDAIDDLPDDERTQLEEELVDESSTAETIEELEAEIRTLHILLELARQVKESNIDRKWDEVSKLIQNNPEMKDAEGKLRKLIIFTEHKDTLDYLHGKLTTLLGKPEAVRVIHGGVARDERRKIQALFTQDKETVILLATDAAGEGVNLQRGHLMINYDLPWNPNRLEQRFGRIHRIGQTEVCHLWNLVADKTREGQVFQRLFEKLERQRKALGGQVFDVLGQIFRECSLRDLLIEAIRYGDLPEVRAKLDQVVDASVGENLEKLVHERGLASHVMSPADVEHIREEMEKAEARKLQPHFIAQFFMEAFKRMGGRISERESKRFEITHVPAEIRNRDRIVGRGVPVLLRYERVTFEKDLVDVPGKPRAEFLCPGHPLLDSVIDLLIEQHSSLFKKGAILVNPHDDGDEPHLLLYLEHEILDGRVGKEGKRRTISKQFHFLNLDRTGNASDAGYAPFLDLDPLPSEAYGTMKPLLAEDWLMKDIEEVGTSYAIRHTVPAHFEEVKRRTMERVLKTMTEVKARLTAEITYWDHRAIQLKEMELAGKQPSMNSGRARQRADELQTRLAARMDELEKEKTLSPAPPVVVGGALVIPIGLLRKIQGDSTPSLFALDRERVMRIAVDAVLATERQLGREPEEQPLLNPGFD